jgi:hypothetical protein
VKIEKPGIYRGVTEADYRVDPCPQPSLTQSLCKVLIERSPRHAWTACPRLNPDWLPDDETKFDLGNVAHRIVLGRGKDFEIGNFDDWRTNAAKSFRAEAHESGKVAVLLHQFEQASTMAQEAFRQISKHEDADAFTGGDAEVMIAWEENGIWFRSLIDWLHEDLLTVDDYKSTGMSIAPHVIGIRAEAAGWHLQAAFIERGLDILHPVSAGRRRYRFIAQETEPPHALNVMHMSEHWMTMGRKKVEAAATIWRACMKTGNWPAYPRHGIVPDYPGWQENRWLERETSGEFDTKLIMAG